MACSNRAIVACANLHLTHYFTDCCDPFAPGQKPEMRVPPRVSTGVKLEESTFCPIGHPHHLKDDACTAFISDDYMLPHALQYQKALQRWA